LKKNNEDADDTKMNSDTNLAGFIETTRRQLESTFGERDALDLSAAKKLLAAYKDGFDFRAFRVFTNSMKIKEEFEAQAPQLIENLIAVVEVAATVKQNYGEDADHPIPHCDYCGSWVVFDPTGQCVHKEDCEWLALQKAIVALDIFVNSKEVKANEV